MFQQPIVGVVGVLNPPPVDPEPLLNQSPASQPKVTHLQQQRFQTGPSLVLEHHVHVEGPVARQGLRGQPRPHNGMPHDVHPRPSGLLRRRDDLSKSLNVSLQRPPSVRKSPGTAMFIQSHPARLLLPTCERVERRGQGIERPTLGIRVHGARHTQGHLAVLPSGPFHLVVVFRLHLGCHQRMVVPSSHFGAFPFQEGFGPVFSSLPRPGRLEPTTEDLVHHVFLSRRRFARTSQHPLGIWSRVSHPALPA